LTPFLARSVGFFPVFFPPEGRLGHAPVHAQPGPIDPFVIIVGRQARLPHVPEDASLDPFLEAIVSRGPRTELGGIQRLPLAAGTQDIQDGLHADPVVLARATAAERMSVHPFRQQLRDLLPQLIRNAPLLRNWTCVHDFALRNTSAALQLHTAVIALQGFFG
jgi:hypothetical protein